jgi:hypothetical protein
VPVVSWSRHGVQDFLRFLGWQVVVVNSHALETAQQISDCWGEFVNCTALAKLQAAHRLRGAAICRRAERASNAGEIRYTGSDHGAEPSDSELRSRVA